MVSRGTTQDILVVVLTWEEFALLRETIDTCVVLTTTLQNWLTNMVENNA